MALCAMRMLGVGLVALGSLGWACPARRTADPVILALGGQEVRRSDFERYVRELEAGQQTALEPAVREALLQAWLERRVLVLEARGRGLVPHQASPAEEREAVQRLLASEIGSRLTVEESEVERHYAEQASEFALPETVTLRQILVPTQNEARDVLRRLQRDPRSFDQLARTSSRGPEAARGGLMGTFRRGELPSELEQAAFALQPGQTSPVVQTPLGHHVLRLEGRAAARQPSLEECRDLVRARLRERKAAQAQRDFVAGLMARAKVNHEAAKIPPHRS